MQAIAKASHDFGQTTFGRADQTGRRRSKSWAAQTTSPALPKTLKRAYNDARDWVLETPPQNVPRRFPFAAAVGFVLAAGAYGATLGGHWTTTGAWLSTRALDTAATIGLTVDAVSFDGLVELEEADLLPIIMGTQTGPGQALDVGAVKDALLANPWIEKADVRRLFPNRLVVDIEERVPVALLQDRGLQLVDATGHRLGALEGERYGNLPVIAGSGAVEASSKLKRLMQAGSWLPSKPRGAVRVGGRRWNLVLEDGSMLRLPARNGTKALARLKALDESAAVLTSALLGDHRIVIDLRYPDQVTFTALPIAVAEDSIADEIESILGAAIEASQ